MSYVQTVLADRPAGFWMITAPSGTSETDLSGNGKTATITEATDLIDRGYRPLVTGSSSDIAYRMYSTNHKLSYPAMEAWEANREHIPFTIEMTFQPVDCTQEAILFAPQAASSAYVMDNGLYCVNNTLRFIVSNGSNTSPATLKTQVQKYLEPGKTYHVVAVYDTTKIKLYVDNVLVDSADLMPGFAWSHTTANFITMSNRVTTDSLKAEFIFDGVSFYRQSLSEQSINNHYFMSTPNNSDVDIVNSLGGKIIKINDEDRVKSFDWSGADVGWNSDDIVLTDTVINDDGSVGLKKIPPLELKGTPAYYGNLLTWNQATGEDGNTTGFGSWQATFAASTAQAKSGQYSIAYTATVANAVNVDINQSIPCSPGDTFTVTGSIRSNGVATATAAIGFTLQDGGFQAINVWPSGTASSVSNSGWTDLTYTYTIPSSGSGSNAQTLKPLVVIRGTFAIGDVFYVDNFSFVRGSNTIWKPPVRTPTVDGADYSKSVVNTLPYRLATCDSDTTQVTAYGGATVSLSTSILNSGYGSFKYVSAGGYSGLSTSQYFPVTPGKTYTFSSVINRESGTATIESLIEWRTGAGAYLSSASASINPTNGVWTATSVTGVAPAGAARVYLISRFGVTSTAGNTAYLDRMSFVEGAATLVEPGYNNGVVNGNIDRINLLDSRYAIARDAGKYVGKNSGGFGFFADFTATENDHVGEQALAALSNTAGDSVIEIVKKADKALYLRYKYLNTAGDLTTTEASWGAISSLLATTPYIYVEWGNGLLSLYVNSTSSPAQIAFDNGVKAPQFDERSYFHLGAGADAFRPWNNNFKWLKFYSEMQDPSMFILNQTSVNGFTAKLGSNLNVSQSGKVQITTLTGSDGTEPINNSRISWTPQNSNISVASGTVDRVNLLSYNQATLETDTAGWYARDASPTLSRATTPVYSGNGSLAVTCSTAGLVAAGTAASSATPNPNYNQIPVKAGVTYTASAKARAGSTTRAIRMYILWYTASGGYSAVSGTAVSTTSGAWEDITISATAPATAAYAGIAVAITSPTAGEIFYFDNLSLYEGTSTTWTPPLRTAVSGYAAQYLEQFSTEPVQYLVDATLTTDDSYYNPVKLDDLKIEDFVDSTQYGENSFDEIVSSRLNIISPVNKPLVTQSVPNGMYVYNGSDFYIKPLDDSANTSIPTGGSGATTAGPDALIRTIEFWVYPETEGYIVFYDGTTEYSLRYLSASGFNIVGFSRLYVDGVSRAAGLTISNANWYGRWHHIVLTNDSAQIDINSSSGAGDNLLTYNQATTEVDTSGFFLSGGNCTATRVNTQAAQGSWSLQAQCTVAASMWWGVGQNSWVPVKPNTTYTASSEMRAATVTKSGRTGVWLYNQYGEFMSYSAAYSPYQTITSAGWTQCPGTFTTPSWARFAAVFYEIQNAALNDIYYGDKLGIWEGSSTTWTTPSPKMHFGKKWANYMPVERFQNISYYPQSFTAEQALANYKAYLGDVTTGSFSDAPGSRTISDVSPKYYANIWNSQTISV